MILQKMSNNNNNKMPSYADLLSLISSDRREFVYKIYYEIISNSVSITNDTYNDNSSEIPEREVRKTTFLSLVTETNKLLENEKEFCKERYIYEFELSKAIHKSGEPKECDKCKLTRYSEKYCENCISLYLQELFNTWTSGNDIIDNFIQECQKLSSLPKYIMEWVPFDQFKDVEYLTSGGFGSIYTATWIRGRIFDYDENKREFTYFGSQKVALKLLNNSNEPGKKFFEEVGSNFHLN